VSGTVGTVPNVLPARIEPMLCRSARPFDSPAHLFEVKWDGVRALAFVEAGQWRLQGRRRAGLASRYPELALLARLPSGTVLDGELVVLQPDGRPDFAAVVGRENGSAARAADAARLKPVVYVVFDLLWERGESLLARPLRERRQRLHACVAGLDPRRVFAAEGVEGAGLALFAAVQQRALEGVVAKELDAPYRPGERSAAWQKIKALQSVHCLILGFEPAGDDDFRSLIVASDFGGELRCVGKVGSGIGEAERRDLRARLFTRRVARPLLDAGMPGVWVEPGLYCTVQFLERMPSGALRAPVFVALHDGSDS
jgi:DNA ligase D-like protein (predicted ligase)